MSREHVRLWKLAKRPIIGVPQVFRHALWEGHVWVRALHRGWRERGYPVNWHHHPDGRWSIDSPANELWPGWPIPGAMVPEEILDAVCGSEGTLLYSGQQLEGIP